jgi:hypothetical protein
MCRISERLGRRLSAARLAVHMAMWTALVAGGCGAFRATEKTHYETVQADAQHDTQLAEAEHAKAIDYFCGRKCGGACDLVKAEEHLQKALLADVTYGPAHNSLGMLYQKQRKLYLAAWEFEYANKLMPERFEPLYNLALVYESADKLDRAIEYASMAFSMAPRNADVLETLIRTRMRNGDPVEEIRPLIKEVLFYETRPTWVCWAKEQLSRAPENPSRNSPFAPPAPGEVPPPEPLLKRGADPPLPQDTPARPPKIARPILPDQATSSTGPVRDGLFLEAAQSDSALSAKSDTPFNQPLLISDRPVPQGLENNTAVSQQQSSPTPGPVANASAGPKLSDTDNSPSAKPAPQLLDTP